MDASTKITVVSWNFNAGSRQFASAEIEALRRRGCLYRLLTPDFRVEVYVRKCPVFSSRRTLITFRSLFVSRSPFPLRSRLSLLLQLFSLFLSGLGHRILFRLARITAGWIRPRRSRRDLREHWFDRFAARHLGDPDLVYLDKANFPVTIETAGRRSIPVAAFQAMPHPYELAKVVRGEAERFGGSSSVLDVPWSERRARAMAGAGLLIAHSRLVADSDRARGIPAEKIRIAYGCVDSGFYRPPDREKKPPFTVLFVGHDVLIKGLFYLLRAWEKIPSSQLRLVIAGDVPRSVLNGIEAHNPVQIRGVLSREQMRDAYQEAYLLVHPAVIDAGPKVVLEAMASGLPVILTRACGYSEIVPDGRAGYIIPPRDPDAVAEKILYCRNHPEHVREMGIEARAVSERLSPVEHGETVAGFLAEMS